ncbi:hypothetical protein NJLHNGOC_11610 [Novacetimonas cocois]|uniref:Uncharacterized protein n=2 Tax=Novacetimonas cocois TaxID=1747507 RepID=A0A365YSY1_9PROT|nr:hypothetical protein NJLHNGOC_11610 [Novacetimonas cocois]
MREHYGKQGPILSGFAAARRGWDVVLTTWFGFGLTDDWQHMIGNVIFRDHSPAADAKEGFVRKVF